MKIALIGCGSIARAHARSIHALKDRGAEVVAVSRSKEKAEAAAAEMKAVAAMAPYEAAITSDEIDAVCILTPHNDHVDLTVQALDNGKHVFIDKPVARTVDEAEPIGHAAKRNPGKVVFTGENLHYTPALVSAAEDIRKGDLGVLSSIYCQMLHALRVKDWRANLEQMGGGVLIDGGIHFVHGMRMLGGEITSVCAMEPTQKLNEMEGEASIQALLRFASGATGILNMSWDDHGNPPGPAFLALGNECSLSVCLPERANRLHKGGSEKLIPTHDENSEIDFEERFGHRGTMTAFVDAIEGKRPPEPSLAEGLQDLRIVEAIYRSLKTKREETVEPLPDWAL